MIIYRLLLIFTFLKLKNNVYLLINIYPISKVHHLNGKTPHYSSHPRGFTKDISTLNFKMLIINISVFPELALNQKRLLTTGLMSLVTTCVSWKCKFLSLLKPKAPPGTVNRCCQALPTSAENSFLVFLHPRSDLGRDLGFIRSFN